MRDDDDDGGAELAVVSNLEAVGQILRTVSNEEVLSVKTNSWDVSGRRRTPVGRWCETRAVMGI